MSAGRYIDLSRYAACEVALDVLPAELPEPPRAEEALVLAPVADALWGEAAGRSWDDVDARFADDPWDVAEAGDACWDASSRPALPPAFWVLYESRDRLLSLFETHDGHLAAVNPARLV